MTKNELKAALNAVIDTHDLALSDEVDQALLGKLEGELESIGTELIEEEDDPDAEPSA